MVFIPWGPPTFTHRETVSRGEIDVEVELRRYLAEASDGPSYFEEQALVWARHAGCGDLELNARPGHYFFRLGRQDALLGHRGFDDRYIVKASDVAVARFWMTAQDAERVLATYAPTATDPFKLILDDERVAMIGSQSVLREGAPEIPAFDRLDAAIAAVAGLARRGRDLAAEWRQRLVPLGLVDAGPVWRTDEEYALVVERGRARIKLDFPWALPAVKRAGLRTRISAPHARDLTAVVWNGELPRRERPRLDDLEDVAAPGDWRARARTADTLAAFPDLFKVLERCHADWLIVEPTAITLGWELVVEEAPRLDVAFAALARWADAPATTGPFR